MNTALKNKIDFSTALTMTGFSEDDQDVLKRFDALKIRANNSDYSQIENKTTYNPLSDFVRSPSIENKAKTKEELLFDACAKVKIITSEISMHLESSTLKNLFYQIDAIHDADDWDTEDQALSVKSYQTFLKWLLLIKPKKGPGLGLSIKGNLVAVWMNNKDKLILEFLSKEKVKWMVSIIIDDETEIASGQTHISRLPHVLNPYQVDSDFFKQDV